MKRDRFIVSGGRWALAIALLAAVACGGPKEKKVPGGHAEPAPQATRAPAPAPPKPSPPASGLTAEHGLPIYPKASYEEQVSESRTEQGRKIAEVTGIPNRVWVYRTDASLEDVAKWYESRLGVTPAITRSAIIGGDPALKKKTRTQIHFVLAANPAAKQGQKSIMVSDYDLDLVGIPGTPGAKGKPHLRYIHETTIQIMELGEPPEGFKPENAPAGSVGPGT